MTSNWITILYYYITFINQSTLTKWGCRSSSWKELLVKTFSFTWVTAGLQEEKKTQKTVTLAVKSQIKHDIWTHGVLTDLRTSGISGLFRKRDDVLMKGLSWPLSSSCSFWGDVFGFDGNIDAAWSSFFVFILAFSFLCLAEPWSWFPNEAFLFPFADFFCKRKHRWCT